MDNKNYFGAMRKFQIESQKLMVENVNLKTEIRILKQNTERKLLIKLYNNNAFWFIDNTDIKYEKSYMQGNGDFAKNIYLTKKEIKLLFKLELKRRKELENGTIYKTD